MLIRRGSSLRWITALACLFCIHGLVWAQKPRLSDQVKALLAEHAEDEALRNAMMGLYSAGLDGYESDEVVSLDLAREYLAAGDYDVADAVAWFQMLVSVGQSAPAFAVMGDVALARGEPGAAGALYASALRVDPEYQHAQKQMQALENGAATPAEPTGASLQAERRDDLARFKGRYGMDGNPERKVSISETCYRSGVLRVTPEWPGVAPWDLSSVADAVFERSGARAVRLEFELDPGSAAEAFVATGAVEGRFVWSSELSDGFEPAECEN